MKTFPILYKRNANGSIQQWHITVRERNFAAIISKAYGQVGGSIQVAEDVVEEGKNLGKSNETSAWGQANLEADAMWLGKKKKGYTENKSGVADTGAGQVITGGVDPMLAHNFDKHGSKVIYPCLVQPKLDGIRCIAVLERGVCTLWTRTRKPINSCPHVNAAIEDKFDEDIILDGELYNHDLHDDFEQIVSLVRSSTPKAEAAALVQYHIYDVAEDGFAFGERHGQVSSLERDFGVLRYVDTQMASNEGEVRWYRKLYADKGYEGVMVRNSRSPYKNGRSYDLLKLKEFEDAEFEIVDVVEGRGKMAGKAIFVCRTEGKTFQVKMEGALDKLAEVWYNRTAYIGKQLTVRYQSLTTAGVPRFPIGVVVRDYE